MRHGQLFNGGTSFTGAFPFHTIWGLDLVITEAWYAGLLYYDEDSRWTNTSGVQSEAMLDSEQFNGWSVIMKLKTNR
jgi:hypothetical protein